MPPFVSLPPDVTQRGSQISFVWKVEREMIELKGGDFLMTIHVYSRDATVVKWKMMKESMWIHEWIAEMKMNEFPMKKHTDCEHGLKHFQKHKQKHPVNCIWISVNCIWIFWGVFTVFGKSVNCIWIFLMTRQLHLDFFWKMISKINCIWISVNCIWIGCIEIHFWNIKINFWIILTVLWDKCTYLWDGMYL